MGKGTFGQVQDLYYICGMENEISIDYDYVYENLIQQEFEHFKLLYERNKMGGNRGIHLTPTNTEEDGN